MAQASFDNSKQLQFIASDGTSFVAYLAEEAGYISGGYGGWQTVSRWKRVSLTQFVGADPVRISLPIIFDGWREGQGQEVAIGVLERMARSPGPGIEPPTVDILGAVPRRDIDKWLIESLDYSRQQHVIWEIQGGVPVRLRQDVVVNLLQASNDDDRIQIQTTGTGFGPGGAPGGARPTPKTKFWVVKAGDTIYRISLLEYGNAKWWRDILQANNLHGPFSIKTGQKLRIP